MKSTPLDPHAGLWLTEPDDTGEGLLTSIRYSPIASVISNPRLPDNPIVAVNDPFCSLTGYAAEEILGRNCRFLAGPATEPWLTETIRSSTRNRTPVLVEILNYKRDGTPFRNAVLVAPVFGANGELEYFIGSQIEMHESSSCPAASRRGRAADVVGSKVMTGLPLDATGAVEKLRECSLKLAGRDSRGPLPK